MKRKVWYFVVIDLTGQERKIWISPELLEILLLSFFIFMHLNVMIETRIFKDQFCEILERQDGILYAQWNGFLKPWQVKRGCGIMTEYVRGRNITRHLSDHRNLKVLSKDVQQYLTTEWFPEIEEVGMKKIAALTAPDPFAKITVEKVNHEARVGDLLIRSFETELECLVWLTS